MDTDGAVDIWYQVEGRSQAFIRGFTGQYIDELLGEIKDKEELSNAASTLQLFVKQQEPDKEISLRKLEDDLDDDKTLNFSELITAYNIGRKNPIMVRLPGMLLHCCYFIYCWRCQ